MWLWKSEQLSKRDRQPLRELQEERRELTRSAAESSEPSPKIGQAWNSPPDWNGHWNRQRQADATGTLPGLATCSTPCEPQSESGEPVYVRADDFFRCAKETTIAADVIGEMFEEEGSRLCDPQSESGGG